MTRRARAVLALALFAGVSPLDRLGVAADSPTLSAGARHTCAIDAADALHCWGDDSDGQTRVPADVAGWRAVAAAKGGCHTCGLALDGGVRCWGCDANGEVSGVPTVPGGNRWISVGAGKGVSCGVASVDRAVRCWGRFMPQVGANPWYGPWSRVAVGEDWVCALSANDAKARCRGWSANGQTTVPPRLADAAWLDLSAGFQHVCGVLATSRRYGSAARHRTRSRCGTADNSSWSRVATVPVMNESTTMSIIPSTVVDAPLLTLDPGSASRLRTCSSSSSRPRASPSARRFACDVAFGMRPAGRWRSRALRASMTAVRRESPQQQPTRGNFGRRRCPSSAQLQSRR